MWIVAAAVGLVGQSLFPDQTDFRILMAEPLSRLTIFGSKLASLLLFVGLFVVNAAMAQSGLVSGILMAVRQTGIDLANPAALFGAAAVLSNIVSNVPAVMLLLPAVMHLIGPAMWWIPSWLYKRLPHFNIERPEEIETPEEQRELAIR